MTDLTHASQKLVSFVELLQTLGGLDLRARLRRPSGGERPEWSVEFEGADTALLTARNGELLHAIEHIAAKILGLAPEEHDRISCDADNFKARRERELQRLASAGIADVLRNLKPHIFPPMMSRERRLLHLALAGSGLHSASIGEASRRSVVLYPAGVTPPGNPSPPTMG